MKKFLYISLILFDLCYPAFSMDELSLEDCRAGKVYEKIDTSAFPPLQSIQDCYQLGASLIRSEIEFWKGTQNSLLKENPRLPIIVKLLLPPSTSPDSRGKPSLLDFKAKLANLELRTKILINQNDPSDTTNKDLFDMHKSYSAIINDLESILVVYESYRLPDDPSTFQTQRKFLRETKDALCTKSKEIEKYNLLTRGLIQSNTTGMNVSRICYSQKGQFQGELPDIFGKYAFCDVEYVTQLFVPVITQLFDATQETLEKLNVVQKTKAVKTTTQKKKGKGKGNKKKTSHKPIVLPQALTTPVTQVIDPEPFPVIEVQSDVPSSKAQQSLEKKDPNTIPQEAPDQPISSILVSENVDTQPSVLSSGPNTKPEVDIASDILLTEEAGLDAAYDMRPWEAYQSKESLEIEHQNFQPLIMLNRAPTFVLDKEYAFTARILLGLENASQEKVTMLAYQQLIIKGLGGAVIDRKKCVYFIARSIFTQEWCSVAMHRLHQDDPHIIPHGTRYWKIARQLLLDVGLDENKV